MTYTTFEEDSFEPTMPIVGVQSEELVEPQTAVTPDANAPTEGAEVVPPERVEDLERRRRQDDVGEGEEDGEVGRGLLLPNLIAGVEANEDDRQDDRVRRRDDEVEEKVRAVHVALERCQAEEVERDRFGHRLEAVHERRVRVWKRDSESEAEAAHELRERDDDLNLGREHRVQLHHLVSPCLLILRQILLYLLLGLVSQLVELAFQLLLCLGMQIE